MWNIPTLERLNKIPRMCATEHVPLKEKEIHLHFFLGGCDWYIAEYDGKGMFFGFSILNNDLEMAEWGYISFGELVKLKIGGWLEVDCELEEFFPVTKTKDIEKISEAQGWRRPAEETHAEAFPEMADIDSVMELKCPVCGCSLSCEQDAETGYCESCCKVVKVNNPFIAFGMI